MRRRLVALFAMLVLGLAASGCSWLQNEFLFSLSPVPATLFPAASGQASPSPAP